MVADAPPRSAGRPSGPARVGPARRVARWATRLVVLLVLLAVALVAVVTVRVVLVARADSRPASDVLVVLGTAQYDGRPSAVFAARLDHAADLHRAGVAPRVVTVGGSLPGDRYTEAAAARTYLVEAGVPEADVVAVETGSDTLTSLQAVDAVLETNGWEDAVLVTDPLHSLRSRSMARDLGIDAATSPTRSGPEQDLGRSLHYLARETAGLLWYRVDRLAG